MKEVRHLRFGVGVEVPVASLPHTYQIVRQGQATAVSVTNDDELIALRTELELTTQFGRGATPEILEALEARLSQIQAESGSDSRCEIEDLRDMLGILRDAMNPATAAAIRKIDEDFPEARGEIDMASVENESQQFQQDVSQQAGASTQPPPEQSGPAAPQVQASPAPETVAAAQPIDPVEAALAEALATATGAQATGPDPVEAALAEAVEGLAGTTATPVDPVEAALAEAVEATAEAAAGPADPVQAALSEVAEPGTGAGAPPADPVQVALAEATAAEAVQPEVDPVEAILAEQNTAVSDNPSPADPVEAILAEQAAPTMAEPGTDAGSEQIVEEILAGQLAPLVDEESVDESIEQAWAEAVTGQRASDAQPEPGSIEADLTYPGEPVETSGANRAGPPIGNDLPTRAEVAGTAVPPDFAPVPDTVSEALSQSGNDIETLASAFEQATSSLDAINGELAEACGALEGAPVESAGFPESPSAFGPLGRGSMAEPLAVEPPAATTSEFIPRWPAAPFESNRTFNLRNEVNRIKDSLQGELERVVRVLDRVDQAHREAESRLAQARDFHQAARRAQEVSEELVAAQSQALDAQAAYEQARQRLAQARAEWETARQAADEAASAIDW